MLLLVLHRCRPLLRMLLATSARCRAAASAAGLRRLPPASASSIPSAGLLLRSAASPASQPAATTAGRSAPPGPSASAAIIGIASAAASIVIAAGSLSRLSVLGPSSAGSRPRLRPAADRRHPIRRHDDADTARKGQLQSSGGPPDPPRTHAFTSFLRLLPRQNEF